MRTQLLALVLGFAVMGTVNSCNKAMAETPDEVRARAMEQARQDAIAQQERQIARENKSGAEGGAKKVTQHRSWIMTIGAPGRPLTFLQIYTDRGVCENNARLLSSGLRRKGWGSAACMEQVNP